MHSQGKRISNFTPYSDDVGKDIVSFNIAPAVPEASSFVSFGLLLVLGLGGVVIAPKRRKA